MSAKSLRTSGPGRWVTRDGSFLAKRVGGKNRPGQDFYHFILSVSWTRFFCLLIASYFVLNFWFGLLYFICGENALEGGPSGSLWLRFQTAFFFSVQTLATIGYGRITPVGLLPNLIVTIEALVGMLMVALGTGLVFARVSRPTARVAFSDKALVTTVDGELCLEIRAANERANQLVDARVAITLTRAERTQEGIWYRNIYDLKLERSWNSVFALSWTIVHPIDAQSPFKDLTPEKMEEDEVMLVVSISGTDDTMAQTVHARTVYLWDEIVVGGQFADMTDYSEEDGLIINLGVISKLE
jgi:inward rectifier potassium channel